MPKRLIRFIYISGPITGVSDYKEKFMAAEKMLIERGLVPLNPVHVQPKCEGRCTQYEEAYNEEGHTWACYLKYDLQQLLKCESVYFLKGWEDSRGAQLEMTVASNCGLELLYEEEKQ